MSFPSFDIESLAADIKSSAAYVTVLPLLPLSMRAPSGGIGRSLASWPDSRALATSG